MKRFPMLSQDWFNRGRCKGMGFEADAVFFPERGQSTLKAKEICSKCVVKVPCLTYALMSNIRDGIWGGMSYRDRRKVVRNVGGITHLTQAEAEAAVAKYLREKK